MNASGELHYSDGREYLTPQQTRVLTVHIAHAIHKYYPDAGIVGVYPFDGKHYRTKAELRAAIYKFLANTRLEYIPTITRNYLTKP